MDITFPLTVQIGECTCQLLHINATSFSAERAAKEYHQHSHAESCELHYLIHGASTLISEQEQFPLSAGMLALIPPGVYHQFRDHTMDLEKLNLIFSVNPDHVRMASEGSEQFVRIMTQMSVFLMNVSAPSRQSICGALERIRRITANQQTWTFIRIERLRAACAELLIELFAEMSRNASAPVENQSISLARSFTIDSFFSLHYSEGNLCQLLADELNVSTRQVNRIIWQTYGMSCRDKLNEIRLKNAMDFLTTTRKPMAEIAELLGYTSLANFSAFIKRETGRTPSRIRSEAQANQDAHK